MTVECREWTDVGSCKTIDCKQEVFEYTVDAFTLPRTDWSSSAQIGFDGQGPRCSYCCSGQIYSSPLKPLEVTCVTYFDSLSLYIIIYISLYIHIYLNWLIETVPILSHGRCSWRTSTVVNHPTKWESCWAQKFGVDHFKTSRGVSHIGFETLHLGTADHKIKEVKWQKLKSQKL